MALSGAIMVLEWGGGGRGRHNFVTALGGHGTGTGVLICDSVWWCGTGCKEREGNDHITLSILTE